MSQKDVFEVVSFCEDGREIIHEVFESEEMAERFIFFLAHAEVNLMYENLLNSERRHENHLRQTWGDTRRVRWSVDEDEILARRRNIYARAQEMTWNHRRTYPEVRRAQVNIVTDDTPDTMLRFLAHAD